MSLKQKLLPMAALVLMFAKPASAQSVEDKAAACLACHGENGTPIDPKFPIIFGQNSGYLYIQLRDMKSGARKNEVMAPLVADMSKDDMLALAQYFSEKTWPSTGYSFPLNAEQQKRITDIETAGQCSSCHKEDFKGDGVIPRLAGQSVDYLNKTTHDFKTRDRANNSFMNDMLATFADDDIALMAKHLAGL